MLTLFACLSVGLRVQAGEPRDFSVWREAVKAGRVLPFSFNPVQRQSNSISEKGQGVSQSGVT